MRIAPTPSLASTRSSARRRWRVTVARVLAIVLVPALLASCVRANVDARVDKNGKLSGSIVIAFSSALLSAAGQSKNDVIADVRDASKEMPKGMKVEVYDVDGYVGERITFSGIPAEQFGPIVSAAARGSGALGTSTAQDFVIQKTAKDWRFFGSIDLTPAAIAAIPGVNGADVAALQKGTQIDVKISFPGVVTARDKDGKVKGKSISWSPKPGQKIQMQAVAKLR